MADKGWISRVATAAGAAAGTGAAQLGLGYGLGVVVWPVVVTTDDSDWLGSLSWATWITASATVFGAVLASRLGGGPARRWSGAWRLALAASAAVGALVAVALIALPARSAVRDDAFPPQVTAGGYALLGVLFGLIVAYFAVASKPIAANLMATGVLLWGLAITSIVVELAWHRESATYLTSWQFAQPSDGERYGTIFWPSALLTLAAAFLIGAIAVSPAIRRGNHGLGAAVSGVVGPLLVAVAFLALAPRLTGELGPLESAYLIAPYAVLAGLAGSALAVTAGRAAADRRSRRAAEAGPGSEISINAQTGPSYEAALDADAVTDRLHSATTSPYDKSDGTAHSGGSPSGQTTESPRRSPSNPSDGVAAKLPQAPTAGPHDVDAGYQVGPANPTDHSDQPETGAPRQRGRLARLIGRAKVPAQSSRSGLPPADARPGSGGTTSIAAPESRGPATAVEAAAAVATPAARAEAEPTPVRAPTNTARSAAPAAPREDPASTPPGVLHPAAGATAKPGSALSGPATPDKGDKSGSAGGATRRAGTAGPASGAGTAGPATPAGGAGPASGAGTAGPARRAGGAGAAAGADPEVAAAARPNREGRAIGAGSADPEIAAAARPNRERARKATTAGPRPAKSTITPPPSEPTIAQINPKPPTGE